MFSARLRLPGSMKFKDKRERVKALIEMLGLTACADTNVGDQKVPETSYPCSLPSLKASHSHQ